MFSGHRTPFRSEDSAYRVECYSCEHYAANIFYGVKVEGELDRKAYNCALRDNGKPCKLDPQPKPDDSSERRRQAQAEQPRLSLDSISIKDGEFRLPVKKVQRES